MTRLPFIVRSDLREVAAGNEVLAVHLLDALAHKHGSAALFSVGDEGCVEIAYQLREDVR